MNSSKKRTTLLLCMTLRVDLFSFVFWEKLKPPKRHFEINWPLDDLKTEIHFYLLLFICRPVNGKMRFSKRQSSKWWKPINQNLVKLNIEKNKPCFFINTIFNVNFYLDCGQCIGDITAAATDCFVSLDIINCILDIIDGANPCVDCVCEVIGDIGNLFGQDWSC